MLCPALHYRANPKRTVVLTRHLVRMASPRAVSGAVNDDVVSRHDKSPGSDVRSRGSRKEDAARHLLSHLAPHRIRRAVHSLRPLVSGTRSEVQGCGDRGARPLDHRWAGYEWPQ